MNKLPDNLEKMRHTDTTAHGADGLSALLLQIVDGGLAGVIFVVPFAMGGRHPLGQLILYALAVVTALAWAIRQSICPQPAWRPTWAMALILAGAILVLLQILPLPQSAMQWLAPGHGEILPLWNAGQTTSASLGHWSFISFTPAETLAGLVLFVTYGLLFFVTVQRIKRIEDVERLLRWCAVSAVCMAVFGLVQYLAGNGKFFWFYNHPFSTTFDGVKGSFTNKNHFAHFLALGVGPLIWWLLHVSRRKRAKFVSDRRSGNGDHQAELKTYLIGLALAIVLFAGLMSLSRGGMAALFLAVVVSSAAVLLGFGRRRPIPGYFAGILRAYRSCFIGLRLGSCRPPLGNLDLRHDSTKRPLRWKTSHLERHRQGHSQLHLAGIGCGQLLRSLSDALQRCIKRKHRIHPCRKFLSARYYWKPV